MSGTVTVLGASSLTEAFTALAHRFEAAHPGVRVRTSFAASSELAAQVRQGAPADVFASADTVNMAEVRDAHDTVGTPRVFARNRLEIAVEPGNPRHVRSLADLARPGTVVVLCASQVPCGRLADEALARAGVALTPASREADVKATLTKVALGEADAGIVYVTDVRANDQVAGVPIPSAVNPTTDDPIAVLRQAPNATGARSFVDFVLGAAGRRVLASFGFLAP